MNELSLFGDKRMTVREVADVLGVTPEAIKKHIREMYPDSLRNGEYTYLDELQVTEIKRRMIPTTRVVGATTSLDRVETIEKAIQYLQEDADRLRAELAIAAPKIESFEALMRSEQTMSITDAAKHFGLHPKGEVFPYLREHGYLTGFDMPSQSAIDAGYLALRETLCPDRTVRKQAVVLTSQLDTWRTRVAIQIREWLEEIEEKN